MAHKDVMSALEAVQMLHVFEQTGNSSGLGARALRSVMAQFGLLGEAIAIIEELLGTIDENESSISEDDHNYVADLRERYEKLKEDIG
jgi:hypothetical protein